MMHIGEFSIRGLTLPPGTLPPDPPFSPLLLVILPFILVLSALYHWRKKDYQGKSELFDKSMMTCLKALFVYLFVGPVVLFIVLWILHG